MVVTPVDPKWDDLTRLEDVGDARRTSPPSVLRCTRIDDEFGRFAVDVGDAR